MHASVNPASKFICLLRLYASLPDFISQPWRKVRGRPGISYHMRDEEVDVDFNQRLVTISAVCLGLSLPVGLPASVNSPRLRRFSHSVLNGCRFLISAWACKYRCVGM